MDLTRVVTHTEIDEAPRARIFRGMASTRWSIVGMRETRHVPDVAILASEKEGQRCPRAGEARFL